jgi:hypothetical protein
MGLLVPRVPADLTERLAPQDHKDHKDQQALQDHKDQPELLLPLLDQCLM